MKQKRKICRNVPAKIPAKWIEIYDCGLCLLASVLIVAGVFSAVFLSGCSVIKKDSSKVMGLEYTVVKEEEIPVELKKLIEAKKANTLRMTYATFFYNGFNVCLAVRDVKIIIQCNLHGVTAYNFIFMNFFSVDLLGPEAGEDITELPTTPYIVLKIEKREESVVFCM
jgi:hypothetical protein